MKNLLICACLSLTAASSVFGVTASTLGSFGGIEEPLRIYRPGSDSFSNDSLINITDQGSGRFRMFLRFRANDWWDADRDTDSEDRQRAEVKVLGPRQRNGETFEYGSTWRTSPNMVTGGRFCHITQVKGYGGGDIGSPLVTTSLKTGGRVAVEYHSSGGGDGTARTWSWTPNTWTRSVVRLKIGSGGLLLASVNGDSFTGVTNRTMDRSGAPEYQPKWGLYRGCDNSQPFGDNYLEHEAVTAIQGTTNPGGVSAPSFSPAGGTYTSAQTVTLSTSTSGASIRYTTDGSTPSSSAGTLYSGPFTVGTTTTVRAIAYTGTASSSVSSATYTINTGGTVSAPSFSPGGGTYTTAQSVTLSSSTAGATIRYTTDSSTPSSTAGTIYTGPITVSTTTTIRAIAYTASASSSVSSATYTISTGTGTPVSFEAENVTVAHSGTGTSVNNDANSSNTRWISLDAENTGSWMEFTTPSIPAGTYRLSMMWKGHPSRGQLSARVDSTALPGTLDQYSANAIYPTTNLGTVTFTSAGTHKIRLTVTGKNSASSNYILSADKFTFTPQ